MSRMSDPNADDRLTEDDRFKNSKTSTIKPLHAVMRCLADFGDSPANTAAIIGRFFDARSSRVFDTDDLVEILEEGEREGYLDKVENVGWRLTEVGRTEIGPMLEMELRYV